MTRQRSELDALNSLNRSVRAARESNGSQQAGDFDDLVSARSGVWLVAAWIAIVTALVMLLGGCGGGIDTADELLYGPPADLVTAPRPCPVDPSACQPQPTGS